MRILFVDDEESVLRGLERLLSTLEDDWDCRFANSGSAALEQLGLEVCDVVISDLRMPQMDGAALFARVQAIYPETVRIVLSGQADQETSLKTVKSAHQFLAKPCAADTLVATIERAELLRRLIGDVSLRALVSKLPNLPSVPAAYDALVREINLPDVSLDRVAKVIASDLAMSAKVLQLVNSAFFGLPRQISDVRQAAALLGLDLLSSLVLSAQAFGTFPMSQADAGKTEALQCHSLSVSAVAKIIATSAGLGQKDVDAAAVGGMLHDIGELVIATTTPFAGRQVNERVKKGASLWDAQRQVLGTTQAEVGAYLLGIWGLPVAVVQAVGDQAGPTLDAKGLPSLALIIHLADAFVCETDASDPNLEGYLARLSPSLLGNEPMVHHAKLAWNQMTEQVLAA